MKKKGDVRSALHMAVEAGNFELVKDLLHHDTADINKQVCLLTYFFYFLIYIWGIQDSNGWKPLHSACMGGKLDIIELLLQNVPTILYFRLSQLFIYFNCLPLF